MKMIQLTEAGGRNVFVNPALIAFVRPTYGGGDLAASMVYLAEYSLGVTQTPSEIAQWMEAQG